MYSALNYCSRSLVKCLGTKRCWGDFCISQWQPGGRPIVSRVMVALVPLLIWNLAALAVGVDFVGKVDKLISLDKPIDLVRPLPDQSPREGSDISEQNHPSILNCITPTTCIVPKLQLELKTKVYLCERLPHQGGVRFYYTAEEGLKMHPNVELVTIEQIHEADYIIYLPLAAPWHMTECSDPSFQSRLIVLDSADYQDIYEPTMRAEEYRQRYGEGNQTWYFMYFKRSFVDRADGIFQGYPHLGRSDVYPLTYSIAEAYVPAHFTHYYQRETDVLCTLRGTLPISTRLRVHDWVVEYGKSRRVKNLITDQVSGGSRTTVSMEYVKQMSNARIIVTVNPAEWEGDLRLWESLCTGALVFVDPLQVPYPYPLLGEEHVVFYDNHNKTDLFVKLDYYRKNVHEARRIALNGYVHAMKHHRTVSSVDYILRSAHLKSAGQKSSPLPQYNYTAQQLIRDITARNTENAVLVDTGGSADDSVGTIMQDGSIVAVDSDFLFLEIKPTSLPIDNKRAGLGVFAKVALKANEILCEYRGAVVPKGVVYDSNYIYSSSTASNIEISIIPESPKPICAYINDCVDITPGMYTSEEIDDIENGQISIKLHEGFVHNAAALKTKMGKIFVVSTRNISKGAEIFYPYGAAYWVKTLRAEL